MLCKTLQSLEFNNCILEYQGVDFLVKPLWAKQSIMEKVVAEDLFAEAYYLLSQI